MTLTSVHNKVFDVQCACSAHKLMFVLVFCSFVLLCVLFLFVGGDARGVVVCALCIVLCAIYTGTEQWIIVYSAQC